jgi:hypothetical protein
MWREISCPLFSCFEDNVKAERFFQPIIANLNHLKWQGLQIHGTHLRFSFSTVVGDNLAAHLVGGFQTCFSNGYFCRRCYIHYTDRDSPVPLSAIKSRTVKNHNVLVEVIIDDPTKAPSMGVLGPSPLRNLIGFHPTTSLPGDLMHDFIEGVCPMVVMSLLKQASSMRLITYGEKKISFEIIA